MNSLSNQKKKKSLKMSNDEEKIKNLKILQLNLNQGGHIVKPLLKHKKKRELIKRGLSCNWTPEEVIFFLIQDEILKKSVRENNGKNWKRISESLPVSLLFISFNYIFINVG